MPTIKVSTSQLERIENALIGNGQEGLLARTARIEENLESLSQDTKEAKEAAQIAAKKSDETCSRALDSIDALTLNFVELKSDVARHHATEHLASLIKKKQFWMIIIIGFIILHILSTYVPNVWDGIMIFLGLPNFILPLN